MKHIKLFEGFEEYGYEKITHDEYSQLSGQVDNDYEFPVSITQNEFDKIKFPFDSKPFKCRLSKTKIWKHMDLAVITGNEKIIDKIKIISNPMSKYINYDIQIIKIEDEWWLVDYKSRIGTKGPKNTWGHGISSHNYYKCDQLHGLLNFLKNNVKLFN